MMNSKLGSETFEIFHKCLYPLSILAPPLMIFFNSRIIWAIEKKFWLSEESFLRNIFQVKIKPLCSFCPRWNFGLVKKVSLEIFFNSKSNLSLAFVHTQMVHFETCSDFTDQFFNILKVLNSSEFFVFFSAWVFFHNHSRITGLLGKGWTFL